MHSKTGEEAKRKEAAAGHDMGSMKGMRDKTMRGTHRHVGAPPKRKEAAAGHGMGSAKNMSGKTTLAMAKPQTAAGPASDAHAGPISASGLVQSIDKANGRIKLTHDPIAAMGWPKMTMFFRLKHSALADQVKEGDKVRFSLEKSATGYVISALKSAASLGTHR